MANKESLEAYIMRLKGGDLDAFDDFYYESYKEIYHFILTIIKDRNLADDLLQDTYMKILKSLSSYKKGTNVFAWMVTIARNLAINAYNKRKREVLHDPYENEVIFGTFEKREDVGPITQLMLETLSVEEVEIVTLHVIYELKHKEIAEIVGRPLGTVLWLYNQAIKKLKEKGVEKYA